MTDLAKTIYPYLKRMKQEKLFIYCNEEVKKSLQSLDTCAKLDFYEDRTTYNVVITDNEDLSKDYSMLESHGIFCGNDHNTIPVKEKLGKFRREEKIGTPILVANGIYFWYKR